MTCRGRARTSGFANEAERFPTTVPEPSSQNAQPHVIMKSAMPALHLEDSRFRGPAGQSSSGGNVMGYPMVENPAGHLIITPAGLIDVASPEAAAYLQPTGRPMFYEVVRLVDGQPLFWDDHASRIQNSVARAFPVDTERLLAGCRQLVAAAGDGFQSANLRIVLTENDYVIHLSPSYYPTPEQFDHGVPTGLLRRERLSPNIKTVDSEYKAAVAAGFELPRPFGRAFELLLVNRDGLVTEGSRANVFFIQGRRILTAPDELILLGITRRYVADAIRTAGAELVTAMLSVEQIQSGAAEAAFLTGSPIDILPIAAIEETRLKSAGHPLILAVHQAYQAIVRADLAHRATNR